MYFSYLKQLYGAAIDLAESTQLEVTELHPKFKFENLD